jgi:hypothetical protein
MPQAPGIRITSTDDLQRSRLTVFFRLILAIPHFLWFSIWTSGMILIAPVMWIATLISRRPPAGLHEVYTWWIRYAVHVYAYVTLAANPFPPFLGKPGTYPVDVEIPKADEVPEQNRWTVGFRFILAMPPVFMASALGGSGGYSIGFGILAVVPFLAWFAILARGRMPAGLEGALLYALGYCAQTYAYFFLATPRYPNAHPDSVAPVEPLPSHPIRVTMDDDPHRSRLTVFFRLPLAIPHLLWFYLWEIVVVFAAIAMWVATLAMGRPPSALHRFLTRFTRYNLHLFAFLYVAAGPFPGFVGAPGSYPIDAQIDGPERQSRWRTFFRLFLAFPAMLISGGIGTAAQVGAVAAWFVSLFTGRVPLGVRALMTWSLRYQAQLIGYGLMLTDVYPFSAPGPCDRAADASPSA